MMGSYQKLHVSAFLKAIVRLYHQTRQTNTRFNYETLDVEISSTLTYIENLQIRITYGRLWSGELVAVYCVRNVVAHGDAREGK